LTSRSFASRLQAASTGVGARQKRVHPSSFTALDIPLPELDEQRGIAHRLDQLTDIAALTDRRTHLADALLPAARNEVFSAMR
jgi:restriction endonuclease S subunit